MAATVNRFSQISRLPLSEKFTETQQQLTLYLSVGDLHVEVSRPIGAGTTKKLLKQLACDQFVQTYAQQIEHALTYKNQAADYLKYSRQTILQNATIHLNEIPNIKPTKIAFDSEGVPPTLIQICFDPNNVYLFTDLAYPKSLLYDPTVQKIICDLSAEQRQFGPIPNAIDIQGPDRKSLVTCVNEFAKVHLQKDKRVHIRGWRHPFTKDQIEYAAADALWIWIVSDKNNLLNNNNATDSSS